MARIVAKTRTQKKQKNTEGTTPRGIDQAVSLAGSQAKLGELLGVSQQAVDKWCRRGYVPLARAIEIHHQLGVSRRVLVDPELVSALSHGFE